MLPESERMVGVRVGGQEGLFKITCPYGGGGGGGWGRVG